MKLPYIGNHLRKKSFADHLLWYSSRENIRDSPPSMQLLARELVCRALIYVAITSYSNLAVAT